MAKKQQAAKRHAQSIRRNARNRYNLSTLRSHLKRARTAVESSDSNAAELVRKTTTFLDKVASKGSIPRTRAARLKSRLVAQLNKAS